MSRVSTILEKVKPLVIPTPPEVERVGSLADLILGRTREVASKFREVRDVMLGGSFAKGTWLPKHVDIDIFVRIEPSTGLARFEDVGLSVGGGATEGYPRGKKYAQHPYTEAIIGITRVNIVPCYSVEPGNWISAADRSPYHVALVSGLEEDAKTQIRLLKRFMIAVGVYGAEIETQGFSGYAAETMIMGHNNVEGVLNWFSSVSSSGNGAMPKLPDPVDEKRDLSVAVSPEKFGRMVLASRGFLNHPDGGYFNKLEGKRRPILRSSTFAILFSHTRLSEDTLWGELRRTAKHLVLHAEDHGFRVARSLSASNNSDRSAVLIVPEFKTLPELEQRTGPTVDRRKDLESFLTANSKKSRLIWVDENARVKLMVPRAYTEVEPLLRDLALGKAGSIGASRELEDGMKKTAKVLHGNRLIREARKLPWLADGVREITTDALGTSKS